MNEQISLSFTASEAGNLISLTHIQTDADGNQVFTTYNVDSANPDSPESVFLNAVAAATADFRKSKNF